MPKGPKPKNAELLNTGLMLKTFIKKNRIYRSSLSRKLGRRYTTVIRYQKRTTMQCNVLMEISAALNHNFFTDIAALLPADMPPATALETNQATRIAELEKEIEKLKLEMAVMERMMK